jgi:hypothetical protein
MVVRAISEAEDLLRCGESFSAHGKVSSRNVLTPLFLPRSATLTQIPTT